MAGQFDAPGEDAAALLRAQELGCLPEAALALVIMTDYRLVGPATDGGILQTDPDWPAAWRVHAARCHRALAVGCNDDIDLLLRLFSEWQRSPDPDGWCATWWIDPDVLAQIESDVAAVFAGLATSGPLGMRHPVDPARAPQVRSALAQAFTTSELIQVGPGRYRSARDLTAEPFYLSPATLVTPGDTIIAMRRDPQSGGVEHIIAPGTSPIPPRDVLAPVRSVWPVGSIVDIETLGNVPAGRLILNIFDIKKGFPRPHGATPSPAYPAGDLPELIAAPTYASAPIDGSSEVRARITGYRIVDDRTAVLVVDPQAPGAPLDPSDQPDLGTWDDIEVVVRGLTAEHHGPMLEVSRTDGLGSFFIAPAAGLDANDHGFGGRLTEGAILPARVVPEPPAGTRLTVSLLPVAIRHLEATITDERLPVPGVVVDRDVTRGEVTVELAHRDTTTGMSHRFTFPVSRLGPGFDPAPGVEVDVVLRPDRSPQRRRMRVNAELHRFTERNRDTFVVEHGWFGLGPSPPQIPAILALLALSDSSVWEREVVWMYEDNLHLEVAMAGPRGSALMVRAAAESPGFLLHAPGRTTGSDPVEAERSLPAAELPHMVAWLPAGAPQRVVGPEGAALAELRAGPGIVSVALAGDIVTVVGESGRAVRSAMSEIQRLILPAKGKLIVPPGQGKRLIGIDGTTLRAIEGRTGCVATPPGDEDELWSIEGPSSQAVKEFIRLASEQVAGVIGRVTDVEDLEVLEDTTIPGGKRRQPPRGAPQPPRGAPQPSAGAPEHAPGPPSDATAASERASNGDVTPASEPRPEPEVSAPSEAEEQDVELPEERSRRKRQLAAAKPPRRHPARPKKMPKIRTGPSILGWVVRAALVLVGAIIVAAALLYLLPMIGGDDPAPAGTESSLGTPAVVTATAAIRVSPALDALSPVGEVLGADRPVL